MDGARVLRIGLWASILGLVAVRPYPGYCQDFAPSPSPVSAPPPTPELLQGHVQEERFGYFKNLANQVRGYADPENAEIISVHQLACLIDHLDKSLYRRGQVVVKGPDVWGQNRL